MEFWLSAATKYSAAKNQRIFGFGLELDLETKIKQIQIDSSIKILPIVRLDD
jgi:hypothetical protein